MKKIEDAKEEEARIMRGERLVRQPTQEEYDEHMRTHIPCRKWCPHYVEGSQEERSAQDIKGKRRPGNSDNVMGLYGAKRKRWKGSGGGR